MTDQELLQQYKSLAPFISALLGSSCEVIVHDVANLDHSIIAIENNLSGRVVGNPITDFARSLIEANAHEAGPFLMNYSGKSKGGNYLSSTYYIKNGNRLIGLLCINKDISAITELEKALQRVREQYNLIDPESAPFSETLDNPMMSIVQDRIDDIISTAAVSPARLSMDEKIELVQKLADSGALMMKGAIPKIAEELHVSVPTIYRYLKANSKSEK